MSEHHSVGQARQDTPGVPGNQQFATELQVEPVLSRPLEDAVDHQPDVEAETDRHDKSTHHHSASGDNKNMTTSQTAPNDGTNEKLPLGIDQIVEDISLSNEQGLSWYNYRLPEDRFQWLKKGADGRQAILADEYDDSGEIIATHKIWIEIEYDEAGTQPSGNQG
jgi:hypothetical protein